MAFINTVPSKDQLAPNLWVTFEMGDTEAKRILFVGNSITRHGVAPWIGWNNDWGMAASAKEKDYVHLTASALQKRWGACDFCIAQAAGSGIIPTRSFLKSSFRLHAISVPMLWFFASART